MTPWLDDGDVRLYHGDVRQVLVAMPDASVDCIVTSPPYWQLRDYGYGDQIGLEPTIEEYVEALVGVFRELRRILAPHGTCWLNLGDSFASGPGGRLGATSVFRSEVNYSHAQVAVDGGGRAPIPAGLKPKDLCLIPFRVALALQADGWWVRQRNVWAKPNPMPESVRDRTTSAAEEVFHLTKVGVGYYYDAEAVRENDAGRPSGNVERRFGDDYGRPGHAIGASIPWTPNGTGRNLRNVWTIATEPTPEAHFATFPLALVERCLLAGCPRRVCRECGEPSRRVVEREPNPGGISGREGVEYAEIVANGEKIAGRHVYAEARTLGWTDCGHDAWRPGIVLDPFVGSGKTAEQARRMGLHAIGVDGSESYLEIARDRLAADRARRWVAPGDRVEVSADQLTLDEVEA